MISAPLPDNETDRIAALHALAVLDSGPEEEFDALVRAASLLCQVPISLISLVDDERQWFKANIGLPGVSETPRDVAFCAHSILDDKVFVVPDARLDPRFADNPLVAGNPDIRFYAGAPIRLNDGSRVGTLCVIDRKPKQLHPAQQEILACLAQVAAKALEGRRATRLLAEETRAKEVSQERFRVLSEFSPLGVFYTDANGSCTYTNPAWQAIYHLSFEESLGNGWASTLHPEDKKNIFTEWQRTAGNGHDFDYEFRILWPDNTVRFVRSRARPLFDSEKNPLGFVGSVEDVTERLQIDRALKKSQEFLDRAGKLAGVGGWELDLSSNTLWWSDETCRIHGVPTGTQPQLAEAINFYAPEARPIIQALVENAIATGESWDVELPLIHANGTPIWVRAVASVDLIDGKATRLFGAFQDISSRRRKQSLLQESEQRLLLATQSGGIGIWDLSVATAEVKWDAQMYRIYGLEPFSESGTYELWKRHLHPDDVANAEQAINAALANDHPFDTEFRVIWADGSVHYVRGTGLVSRNAVGEAVHMVGTNWDVTPLRVASATLEKEHELLQVTLASIGDAVITTNEQGQVVWLNPVAERMTGWSTAEAANRPLAQVFHIINEETRLKTENPVDTCLMQGKIVGLANHTILVSRDGTEYGIEDSASPIRNKEGEILGVVLVFHDVTEARRLSGEMSYRATHDALTGLFNRAEFEARLHKLLQEAHNEQSEHALMYIDLDQFKLVNDACGHAVGDQLLQQVSKLLGDAVRTRDTLARLGGDEFAIILEKCSAEQGQRVAQQICDRMEEFRFLHDERRFRIGTSIGLVPVDNRWSSTEAILQAADTSCYAAKEAGRNRVHAWFDTDHAMRTRHGEMQWTSRIEQALDDNQFALFAQRIVPIGQPSNLIHAEVLLRMKDSDGKLIPPGAFLPAAERFHLASRIDRWVVKHSIDWLLGLDDLKRIDNLSVNLSGQSIGDRAFHRWAMEQLQEAGSDVCHCLCFEITETAAITNLADAALFIEQVRSLGIKVALDDFGAGASSFGYLKTMAVDFLKIDGQFVRDVVTDPLDEAAVRCFADVARVVGVKTVAEFVDQASVLTRLTEIGIDYAQGYLLHKPEPIDRLLDTASAPEEVLSNVTYSNQ